eukprot:gene14056-15520_t
MKNVTLRVDLKDKNGTTGYAKYPNFQILSEDQGYMLKIGKYESGNLGDSLKENNNMKFTTADRDNDEMTNPDHPNCAETYKGPWWHNRCFKCNLNNLFYYEENIPPTAENAATMTWHTWTNQYVQEISYSQMMLRVDD